MNPAVTIDDQGRAWVAGEDGPRGFCWCGCGEVPKVAVKTVVSQHRYKGVIGRWIFGHPCRLNAIDPKTGFIRGEDRPRGLCWCGCGEATEIARRSDAQSHGYIGVPNRYLTGHHNPPTDLTQYEVDDNGCWIWTGGTWNSGYPQISWHGKRTGAYRVLWEVTNGRPVPAGLEIDHLCRVPACVNPEHLEPVTGAENNRRKYEALGIGPYSVQCSAGHRWDEGDNLYISPAKGQRICRACQRERQRSGRAAA